MSRLGAMCGNRQVYEDLVGECWLQSARVSRRAGHHQTAFNALLNAENSRLSELFVEKAKWLWSKVLLLPPLTGCDGALAK